MLVGTGLKALSLAMLALMWTARAYSDWQVGRATFYGTDGWSIHQGSCGFYYIFEDEPLGWDVAAMTDVNPLYPGSCGSCFEVKCNPIKFTDGNGEEYDRTQVCKDPDQSLVFRITDTCPCNYAANAASNKRWCCGDMTHYDMSIWAFEKLADTQWGVIGLQWRQPDNPAPAPAHPNPGQQPPKGTQYPPAGYWDKPRSQWPGSSGSLESDADTSVRLPGRIYNQTLLNNWTAQSYNATLYQNASALGAGELITQCTKLAPNGTLVFTASGPGYFLGKLSLSFWAQYATSARDLQLSLASSDGTLPQGTCSSVILTDLTPAPSTALVPPDMLSYTSYLGAFQNSTTRAGPNALAFQGCPGVSPNSIDQVIFSNAGATFQQLCLGDVQLLDGNAV